MQSYAEGCGGCRGMQVVLSAEGCSAEGVEGWRVGAEG